MRNLLKNRKGATRNFRKEHIAPFLYDGAIATTVLGEGRLITVLILDKNKHREIHDLALIHRSVPSGDVKSQWAMSPENHRVFLHLIFERPIEFEIVIPFNVADEGNLVDNILRSQAVYLQAGQPGDRVSTTFDEPKVIVEVPQGGFEVKWQKIWLKALTKNARMRGLNRQRAKEAALKAIELIRSFQKGPVWKI
ncbi:MAG: hypothetical protein KIT00_05925 [Rhodospirillales bacterium]|nr:hypothetical protein [Rhodospirillales bacterium]